MSMDAWLAQAYGTNGTVAEDIEKIAQAEMAQQMAQQEGIDLSGLNEDQIASLGQEVLGQEGQQGQPGMQQGMEQGGGEIDPSQLTDEHVQQAQAILEAAQAGEQVDPAHIQEAQAIMQVVEQLQGGEQQPQQQMAKVAEAQAKFEEADFLGRVMAHAFNQESEKIASSKYAGVATHAKNLGNKAIHHAGNAAKAVDRGAQNLGKKVVRVLGRTGGGELKMNPNTARAIGYGAGATSLAGAGAAAHQLTKEAAISVIEKAAMQQAANILSANGIDPASGQPVDQQQPQQQMIAPANGVQSGSPQAAQQVLGDLVEKRAHQILRGLGYNI